MNKHSNYMMVAVTLAGTVLFPLQAQAQAVGGDQTIFQDDQQVVQDEGSRIQRYEASLQNKEQSAVNHDAENERYRDYAQNTVQHLQKLRAEKGPKALSSAQDEQLNKLQEWLSEDAQVRSNEEAQIQQLKKSIGSMQKERNGELANLDNDVNAMRQDREQQAEDTKFNQMMAVNQFNELQSEMGAATWGAPPRDGTYNSVGGYGPLGGYGYSFGGGRRDF